MSVFVTSQLAMENHTSMHILPYAFDTISLDSLQARHATSFSSSWPPLHLQQVAITFTKVSATY